MDGIIVINKEKGCTSHDIVYKIRKMFNTKVGHTGTLDPNATGVLPILLGKGTKISKYLIEHDKEYEVVLQLGVKTTTADEEGEIIEEKEVLKESLEQLEIERILKSFIGKIKQMPPKYSAIKVNGRKLYEYARKGQEVEIKPREVEIYNIEITNIQKEKKQIEFKVSCSKGTYIRTLCEDIAEKMRTVGYMKELKRTKVGNFNIEQAITLGQLQEKENIKIITIEEMFKDKEEIILEDSKIILLLNGVKMNMEKPNGIYRIYNKQNKFIGLGIVQNKILKIDIRS
ncbi:MAG TPA: tRNA pseudouridine(55) synthase TruB [Clostridiales bacterium]|jgi:tRNA pseudouridine55 synthase|nr:tRNA pseudouridine(55) synthase TruB [Clostridiales bacterium]